MENLRDILDMLEATEKVLIHYDNELGTYNGYRKAESETLEKYRAISEKRLQLLKELEYKILEK